MPIDIKELNLLIPIVNEGILEFSGNDFQNMDTFIVLRHLSLYLDENNLSIQEFKNRLNDSNDNKKIFEELNEKFINFNSTFFSGYKHFESFIKNILTPYQKELVEIGEKTINFWSSSCGNGEEPFSLDIILRENVPNYKDFDFKVDGSDLSDKKIQRAKKGLFFKKSFFMAPTDLVKKYFTEQGDQWKLEYEILKSVEFRKINLIESLPKIKREKYHVVLCRNTLNHFNADHKKKVVSNLFKSLKPGGYLLLGPNESLTNKEEFLEVTFEGLVAYQKAETTFSLAEKEYKKLHKGEIPEEILVKEGEMEFTNEDGPRLKALLGSCIAIVLHDFTQNITGLCHYITAKSGTNDPYNTFNGDYAITLLIEKMQEKGCKNSNIQAKIFGAAQVGKITNLGKEICQKNIQVAEEILSKNKILILEQDLLGFEGRQIIFNPKDRKITVKKVV